MNGDSLRERYDGLELVGYRERDRPADTAGGFRAALESSERKLVAALLEPDPPR